MADNVNALSFIDVARQTHNNELITMVDEITKPTTLLSDATWKQSTDMLRDVTGARETLPESTWTAVDDGVKPSKGSHIKRDENMGILESWSEVSEKSAMISPNPEALRWENDSMHLTGMGMDLERGLLYGNEAIDPAMFNGFLSRFDTLTDFKGRGVSDGKQKEYVTLDAGGNGSVSNASMLFVVWGNQAVNMLYPRFQTNNGIQFNHFGYENITDADGKIKRVARSQFITTAGLSIANRFATVAIRNIETDTVSAGVYMPKLVEAMYKAWAAIPAQFKSKVKIYTSPEVILALRMYYADKVRPATYAEAIPHNAHGDIMFDNFIIRQCDSMIAYEDVIA